MPDDLGDLDEEVFKRIEDYKQHKLEMKLKGIDCKCELCKPSGNSNKMPAVSTF